MHLGGTHMLRYTGTCHRNGLVFHKKSLDMDSILSKKSLAVCPIPQILQKETNVTIFEANKPLEVGPNLLKLQKKKNPVKSAVFEVEKSIDDGFQTSHHTPHQKQMQVYPQACTKLKDHK